MLSPRPRLSKLPDIRLLGRLKDLGWLSAEQLKNVRDSMSVQTVAKNDIIFRDRGQAYRDTLILLLGTAQLSYVGKRGPRAIAIMPPGLVNAFPVLPAEVGHNFELKALNECRVASLPAESFATITFGVDLSRYTRAVEAGSNRLGNLLARQARFVELSLAQRLVLTLMELMNDFGVRDARGMLLRISPTHEQLAELAGASRSKVTKGLSELEREGMIQRSGRRLILDMPAARALVADRRVDEATTGFRPGRDHRYSSSGRANGTISFASESKELSQKTPDKS